MGVMLQDTFIFSGTVRENIRYGRLDATDEEIMVAARAVHAHEFIIDLPDGYDTVVQERGSTLSAGQRQLIAFARVLLADPRILILDEATSNIDTRTEEAGRSEPSAQWTYEFHHRASSIHHRECGRNLLYRPWAYRRAGQSRRAVGQERRVLAAVRIAVCHDQSRVAGLGA